MLTWHYVTHAAYAAADAATKTSDKLYFLSDTREIYRGTELFSHACEIVSAWPSTPAVGRVYIDATTLEGRIYNGTEWKTVIQPVQAAVDASDTSKPVSGKAVADYVTDAISDVTAGANNAFAAVAYDDTTHVLTFTSTDGKTTKTVDIGDMPVNLTYDKATGELKMVDEAGTTVGTAVNLDLERFVKSGSYDPETQKITMVFNDDQSIEIDASALVDVYTGDATSTAAVTVSADNKITAAVKVSAEANNQVVAKEDGLYVAPTDLSNYATDDEVEAIRSALQTSIDAAAQAAANEKTRAEAKEAELNTAITKNAADIAKNTKAIDDEAAAARAAEAENKAAAAAAKSAADAAQADATQALADAAAAQSAADDAQADATQALADAAAAQTQADKGVADAAAAAQAAANEKTRAEGAEAGLQEQITANAGDIDTLEAALTWKTTV